MAEPALINRFIELGYEPDFVDNDEGWVCFNSTTHDSTIIKIRRSPCYLLESLHEIRIMFPSHRQGHFSSIESIIKVTFKWHGILQSLPSKGVFVEGQ